MYNKLIIQYFFATVFLGAKLTILEKVAMAAGRQQLPFLVRMKLGF